MSDESQRIVTLNPDQTEYVLKEIAGLYAELAQLSSDFRHGKLTKEMRSTYCSLMEYRVAHIGKTLGYYGDLDKEMERRSEQLRKANQRVRELEKLVGSTRPLDGLGHLLMHLADELRDFWSRDGFNYVSDVEFLAGGIVKVKFGFSLDSHRMLSTTPVSDRKELRVWLQEKRDAGYILVKEADDVGFHLLDCDHNRRLLTDLLTTRYPSLSIFKWDNLPLRNCDGHKHGSFIFHAETTIRDIKDIPNQKEPAETEDTPHGE